MRDKCLVVSQRETSAELKKNPKYGIWHKHFMQNTGYTGLLSVNREIVGQYQKELIKVRYVPYITSNIRSHI